jgi:nitrogen fixation protein NifX
MPEIGHLKIAVTSNSLTRVDVAFALAKQILFYDVTYDSAEFIDSVRFGGGGGDQSGKGMAKNGGDCWMMADAAAHGTSGDRITPRVEAVKGCHVVISKGLSDLAAVKLHDHKVFPVKLEAARDIDEVISSLQKMMNSAHPPLWLRKALGYGVRNPEYQVEKTA